MPPKAKQPSNGKSEAKPKQSAAPAAVSTASEGSRPATTSLTKPDTAAYHAEQDALKKEIDEYQAKLVCILSPLCHKTLTELVARMRSRKRLLSPREPVEMNAGMLFVLNWMLFVDNRAIIKHLGQNFWSRSRQCKPEFKPRYAIVY
jgi:hypothetical protein